LKTALLIAFAALLAATTLAAPVSAATPSERRIARQVKTLQTQVKTLQRQVRTLRRQMREAQSIAAGSIVYGACLTAATADAFQGTWETIDKDAVRDAQPEFFPPLAPIADPLNSCQRLEVQRQANPAATPTTDVFAAMLNIFR
jgi:outer membrane murein-binding lipoprotein Lpp